MPRKSTVPRPLAMPANDDRLSHADSRVLVYWLRRVKQVPVFVFPLDRFYKVGIEEVVKEVERTTGLKVNSKEIEDALGRTKMENPNE